MNYKKLAHTGATNFETPDLFLAATLQTLGYPVQAFEWVDSYRCIFFFKTEHELVRAVERFWRQELRLEPNALFTSLKALKTRLRSFR